jgi:Zn finger protein HypA/HybF involved in hydrogenase expression
MSKVIDINELSPHKVSEVICLKCLKRWLAVRPKQTKLKDLECPQCGEQGYVIETGETLTQL